MNRRPTRCVARYSAARRCPRQVWEALIPSQNVALVLDSQQHPAVIQCFRHAMQ